MYSQPRGFLYQHRRNLQCTIRYKHQVHGPKQNTQPFNKWIKHTQKISRMTSQKFHKFTIMQVYETGLARNNVCT